jgi:hypothetical protein
MAKPKTQIVKSYNVRICETNDGSLLLGFVHAFYPDNPKGEGGSLRNGGRKRLAKKLNLTLLA